MLILMYQNMMMMINGEFEMVQTVKDGEDGDDHDDVDDRGDDDDYHIDHDDQQGARGGANGQEEVLRKRGLKAGAANIYNTWTI